MTVEHPAEHEVPQGSVREPRQLDEHDRPRRVELAEVGHPAAAVDVQREIELLAQVPERLVVGVPELVEP